MDKIKLKRNLIFALISQVVATGVSALSSLIIPRFIGVEQFGYFQLFLFYTTYTGFFHFGLNDGVYLVHGGENLQTLPKKSVNSQFLVGVIFQSCIAALLFSYALLGPFDEARGIVIAQTAIMIVVQNASLFLGYVFQAINETKWFSISLLLAKGLYGLSLVVLAICHVQNFYYYSTAFIVSTIIALIYCIIKGAPILSAGFEGPRAAIVDSVSSIRVGCKLLIANLASMVILGIARWLIDVEWGIEAFSQFSLSLQLVTFVSTFLSQVAMVLFPSLRSVDTGEQKQLYISIKRKLDLFLPVAYIGYFPLFWVVSAWLPKYETGLSIMYLLLPICVFDGKMLISSTTFYKVLRKESELLLLNIISALVSVGLCAVFLFVFMDPRIVMLGAVMAIVFRSILAEISMSRHYEISYGSTSLGLILITVVFLLSNILLAKIYALIVVSILYLLFLYISTNRKTFIA